MSDVEIVGRLIARGATRIDLRTCTTAGEIARSALRSWDTGEQPPEVIADQLRRVREADCARLRLPAVYAVVGLRVENGRRLRLAAHRIREAPPTREDVFAETPTEAGITAQAQRLADSVMGLHAKSLATLVQGFASQGAVTERVLRASAEIIETQGKQIEGLARALGTSGQQLGQERARLADGDSARIVAEARIRTIDRAMSLGERIALPLIMRAMGPAKPAGELGTGNAKDGAPAPAAPAAAPAAGVVERNRAAEFFGGLRPDQTEKLVRIFPAIGPAIGARDVDALRASVRAAEDRILYELASVLDPAQAQLVIELLNEGPAS